jgi:hypothetical protein
MNEVVEEIKTVNDKILAIEFLSSFSKLDESERQKEVKGTLSEAGSKEVQHYVNVYARYSEPNPQGEKKQLQEKENILIAQRSGTILLLHGIA